MTLFRQEVLNRRQECLHGEVILTQPLSTRVLVLLLFVVLLGAVIWLAKGSYARTEAARGILVTDTPSTKIIAPSPGILATLDVNEGTLVAKGDRLGIVDTERLDENGAHVVQGSIETFEKRLLLSREQSALVVEHKKTEQRRLQSVIRLANSKIMSLNSQLSIQRDIVSSNKSLFDQLGSVVAKGFVSRAQYENKRQVWLNSQQQYAAIYGQSLSIRSELNAAKAQLAGLSTDAEREMNEINASTQTLQQQRAEIRGSKSYSLVAPIAGRVTALQVDAGSAVRLDIPLMRIVPAFSSLRAEIYAPSRAIGFVRPGQEVRLLYDAFPYQRFGGFAGTVRSVSLIVIDPRDLEVPFKIEDPVYRVTVALDRQSVLAYGQNAPLQPGMTLTGNMILERQSFLSWLLMPLTAVLRRN